MGCDIHGWVEKRVGTKWISVRPLEDRSRNYTRFALLAGVRGAGSDPRGIPSDVADTTKLSIDEWGGDGHSHSYLPLKKAYEIFKSAIPLNDKSGYSTYDAFGIDVEEIRCEHCQQPLPKPLDGLRLVFWFDN